MAPEDPSTPSPPPADADTVAPELLDAEDVDDDPVPPPVIPAQESEETSYDAALARELALLYRPPHNPGRLAVTARLMFANIGANDHVGGRMGGLQADVGQSWNFIGYGLTASLWAGRVVLDDRTSDLNTLIGVGPTLNLGRRALIGRGYLDLRLGYDFFFGNVRQRDDAGDQGNVAPHGPRVQLSLGLLSSNALAQRRWFHGFGATLGYQGLVGSFTRDMPYMSMLTVGISYWMG